MRTIIEAPNGTRWNFPKEYNGLSAAVARQIAGFELHEEDFKHLPYGNPFKGVKNENKKGA